LQVSGLHDQAVQEEPSVGPVSSPVRHSEVSPHQPQPPVPVHELQSPRPSQLPPPPHSLACQYQVPQVPLVGPSLAPLMQAEVSSHQPQPLSPVQSAQLVQSAQGSVAVEHVPLSQARPVQQSSFVAHDPSPCWQPQVPSVQAIWPQQSRSLAQGLPASAQQLRSVGLARQERPAQHSVAEAQPEPEGLQLVPPPPPPDLHVPAWQVRPEQQSAGAEHAWPAEWQPVPPPPLLHVPLWHVRFVQQSALTEHAWPLGLQVPLEGVLQVPLWHVNPVQQSPETEHAWPLGLQPPEEAHFPPVQVRPEQHWLVAVHVWPDAVHVPPLPAVLHVPLWQVRPAQHSLEPAQAEPLCLQPPPLLLWHLPPVQVRPAQHWLDAVQDWPEAVQPPELPLLQVWLVLSQVRPVQQSVVAVHAWPDGLHVPPLPGVLQVPLWHWSPVWHGVTPEPVQQGCVSEPQLVWPQFPPAQVPVHTWAQPPQFFSSVWVFTHLLEQQVAPVAVQVLPVQQAWPTAPQVPVVVLHLPLWQVRPALHVSPVQQF
jgi:hypothetical protein